MKDKFRIRMCSDLEYEEMVADIIYENHTVATITQESGIEKMEIEIFPFEGTNKSWKFLLSDFVENIELAKKKLIEMRKLPE